MEAGHFAVARRNDNDRKANSISAAKPVPHQVRVELTFGSNSSREDRDGSSSGTVGSRLRSGRGGGFSIDSRRGLSRSRLGSGALIGTPLADRQACRGNPAAACRAVASAASSAARAAGHPLAGAAPSPAEAASGGSEDNESC